jgi:hypothetical protein
LKVEGLTPRKSTTTLERTLKGWTFVPALFFGFVMKLPFGETFEIPVFLKKAKIVCPRFGMHWKNDFR